VREAPGRLRGAQALVSDAAAHLVLVVVERVGAKVLAHGRVDVRQLARKPRGGQQRRGERGDREQHAVDAMRLELLDREQHAVDAMRLELLDREQGRDQHGARHFDVREREEVRRDAAAE
jgi:hypothetical protein